MSQNGRYELRMQTDGNLAIYCQGNRQIWQTSTYGRSIPEGLKFQSDSNVVIYDTTSPIWNSVTHHSGATDLIMQDDGNLVLYKGSTVVWQTKTQNKCHGDRSCDELACPGKMQQADPGPCWAAY